MPVLNLYSSKKNGPFFVVAGPSPASLIATRDSRNGAVRRKRIKTLGSMRAEQTDDRQKVNAGGHFMELLVS